MSFTSDQCAVLAQVIPTFWLVLVAQAYFWSTDHGRVYQLLVGALTVLMPVATMIAILDVDGGAGPERGFVMTAALAVGMVTISIGSIEELTRRAVTPKTQARRSS